MFEQHTWRNLHLQIIYFGREHCPAQRHDPASCRICSWAAVPPYNMPGKCSARITSCGLLSDRVSPCILLFKAGVTT